MREDGEEVERDGGRVGGARSTLCDTEQLLEDFDRVRAVPSPSSDHARGTEFLVFNQEMGDAVRRGLVGLYINEGN